MESLRSDDLVQGDIELMEYQLQKDLVAMKKKMGRIVKELMMRRQEELEKKGVPYTLKDIDPFEPWINPKYTGKASRGPDVPRCVGDVDPEPSHKRASKKMVENKSTQMLNKRGA